ncbi:quinoprotein glucose dehydrogenase [Sphingobium faniae]|nr:quinoprotein glucose dehydrogenase [Sphingobium faniae]
MSAGTKATAIASGRYALACLLALVAAILAAGGAWLIALGGSPYYLLAGLAVALSAYWSWRGDVRAMWSYGLMLAATLLWTLFERGLSPWALQARMLAPLVLGLWLFWPLLRRLSWKIGLPLFLAVVVLPGLLLVRADSVQAPAAQFQGAAQQGKGDWEHYGNDLGGSRFSPLTQINSGNIDRLNIAWTFRTGSKKSGMGFQATPLMIDDSLFLCTPDNIIIALDAETGKQRWRFDPKVDAPPAGTCRGVAYYRVPAAAGHCAERIIFATVDARMMAVDRRSGALCRDFGQDGTIDLKHGMGQVLKGYYYISSAPTIVRGRVAVGGWVMDGQHVGEPSGVVRAYDATSGRFAWAWDMDRPDFHGEPPAGQTYSRGTANSWAPMSGDEALGLIYVPTGNATPDYWGGARSQGSEKYASSVVALDMATGAVRWSFQTTHHDLWDYDVASQPTLIDLPIGGGTVPALIQPTKRGEIFLLDRRDGRLLSPVRELPVPQGAAAGDFVSPTQPFSVGMPAFDRTRLSEARMWGATPLDQLWCRIRYRQARDDGTLTPPGVRPAILYPSQLGGIGWGGVSIDPERRLMTVNWNRIANYTRLVPRDEAKGVQASTDGSLHIGAPVAQIGTPFAADAKAFLSPLGIPCTEPPFGKIAVVDLDTRKIIWERPLGSAAGSGPFNHASHLPLAMGVPNAGGSLTTRAGLAFIAATQERAIRAYETANGRMIWRRPLPVGGHATPMTYISPASGRQFVVVAAGGNATLASGAGDYVMAYALPGPHADQ